MKDINNMTLRELVAFVTFATGKTEDQAMQMTMRELQGIGAQMQPKGQYGNIRSMQGHKRKH
ncbi:hypothetical protein [Natribacillus halophilus]|uniref:Uncharacterized protein n=1 Tax=Natribacillus halophilus TaxID=549003 RepID=A0A1G8RT96_9BACI|nr:hypothetical protein [Natribacillus halophilus]SDJ20197.1 hypothetical protein SAMN04488123_12037 [Natribacillus halophilus]